MSTLPDAGRTTIPADVHDVYLVGTVLAALLLGSAILGPVLIGLAIWRCHRAHPAGRAIAAGCVTLWAGWVVFVLAFGTPVG